MNKTLRALYDRFYEKPELPALHKSLEANHRLLIERLDKPERKLVLRIIDDETSIAGALSLDAFLCGFRLAWQLSNELNNLDEERSVLADEAEQSVHFLSEEGGDRHEEDNRSSHRNRRMCGAVCRRVASKRGRRERTRRCRK